MTNLCPSVFTMCTGMRNTSQLAHWQILSTRPDPQQLEARGQRGFSASRLNPESAHFQTRQPPLSWGKIVKAAGEISGAQHATGYSESLSTKPSADTASVERIHFNKSANSATLFITFTMIEQGRSLCKTPALQRSRFL